MAGRLARLVYQLRRRDGLATSLLHPAAAYSLMAKELWVWRVGQPQLEQAPKGFHVRLQHPRRSQLTFDLLKVVPRPCPARPRLAAACRSVLTVPSFVATPSPRARKSTGAPRRSVPKSQAFSPMAQFQKRLVREHAGIDDRFAGRAVWLPILIIGPFVVLLFCASPHSDDICFAATWRDVGLHGNGAQPLPDISGPHLQLRRRHRAVLDPWHARGRSARGFPRFLRRRPRCDAHAGALGLQHAAADGFEVDPAVFGLDAGGGPGRRQPAARGYDLLGHRHWVLHNSLAVLPGRDDLALSPGCPHATARPVCGGPARGRRDADRHRDGNQRAGAARHRGRGVSAVVACWPMRRVNRWPMH